MCRGTGPPAIRLAPFSVRFCAPRPYDGGVKKFSILLAMLIALALPGAAVGQGSGGDVYEEDVPGAGGNQPSSGNNGDNGSGGGGSALPSDSGSQSGLAAKGEDGAAAAELAQSTSPGGSGSSATGGDDGTSLSGGEAAADPDTESSGPGGVAVDLLGGSDDGMGLLLPIILASVLVAGAAFVLIRRSGGSTGSA